MFLIDNIMRAQFLFKEFALFMEGSVDFLTEFLLTQAHSVNFYLFLRDSLLICLTCLYSNVYYVDIDLILSTAREM